MSLAALQQILSGLDDQELLQAADLLINESASRGLRQDVSSLAYRARVMGPGGPIGVVIPTLGVQASGAAPTGWPERTEFDVALTDVPPGAKVPVVKALRNLFPNWSLDRAIATVRDVAAHEVMSERPYVIAEGITRAEAEDMVKNLRAAGAGAKLM